MIAEKGIPLLNTIQISALALLIWETFHALRGEGLCRQVDAWGRRSVWLAIPGFVLIAALGVNGWLARSIVLVKFDVQYWDAFTVQPGQMITQALPLNGSSTLTGIRLRASSKAPAEVEVCILAAPEAEPLLCTTQSTAQSLDGVYLDIKVEAQVISEAYVRLRVLGEDALITRIGHGAKVTAYLDGVSLDGGVELFALVPVRPAAVLRDVQTALADAALFFLQALTLGGIALGLVLLLSREV